MGHDEAGVDLALNDLFAPSGILSPMPTYTPGMETVPALRQHVIAWRSTCTRSVARLHFVDGGVRGTMAGCLAAHRIDAAIGAAVVGQCH
jgi:hypothetical protein